jgi:hypothetical protein
MADEIFITDVHPVSGRWAILDDNGNSAWLYLSAPGTQQPEKDAFAYSPVAPVAALDIDAIQRGIAPILTTGLASSDAVISGLDSAQISFLWAADGESVAVAYQDRLLAMIVSSSDRGYSAALAQDGEFGQRWDEAVFEQHFFAAG